MGVVLFKFISVVALSFIVTTSNAKAETIEFDNKADEQKYEFILAVKNRDCKNIFAYLNEHKPHFFRMASNLSAYFLEAGICVEANPELAAKEYLEIIDFGMSRVFITNSVFAMVRLGNLYYQGLGVVEDHDMAMYYFKQASMEQINFIWGEQDGASPEYFSESNDVAQKIWGLSKGQLENIFSTAELGPLPIPQPLIDEVNWLKSINTGDGSKILVIAHHFHEGTGGYRQNLSLATAWLLQVWVRTEDEKYRKIWLKWTEEEFAEHDEFIHPQN
jgi:hypothetical protein